MLPETDCFYLDMNGIIHNCTHPGQQDVSKSLTQREMMLAIFRYIDRCVSEIVKPKKLLYMAIDGVAPRAKLNQQRARRFRSAQDREESIIQAKQRGETVDEANMFDSNCITPGTEFMDTVCKHIRYFIKKKVKEDPLWRDLEIVFSGGDVPGEGEHKIMQYIRDQRALPGYEANLRHCMYGQDADLIMLGLCTHEPHFMLLREVIDFGGSFGGKSARQTVIRQTREAQFQLLHLSVLREYLEVDIARDLVGSSIQLDKERIIDDFVFMTFLVGNDFLPHLPTLDIGEHAFDTIFDAYKTLMLESPGYLVEEGSLSDMNRLERFFQLIGAKEEEILIARDNDIRQFTSKQSKRAHGIGPTLEELEEAEAALEKEYRDAIMEALGTGQEADDDTMLELRSGPFKPVQAGRRPNSKYNVGVVSGNLDDEDAVPAKDYRGRYYFEKFKVLPGAKKTEEYLDKLMESYLEGLLWCLAYYSKGCVSWDWYFPYYYGPMLQDMKNLESKKARIKFNLGKPFWPFQQLLGCLPPASAHFLPRAYRWLMTNKESPIIEYYPLEFGIDMNGKKNPWEAVTLLPFIDEKKLLEAEVQHCPGSLLGSSEMGRNSFGTISIYHYDPTVTTTYFSCNPEIGLADITNSQSTCIEKVADVSPGHYLVPEVIKGTISPYPGFPSLSSMQIQKVEMDFIKLNVFGGDSKYRTMSLEVLPVVFDEGMDGSVLTGLLGRSVYVNYPMSHEAKVVAVSTKSFEYRLDEKSGEAVYYEYDKRRTEKWLADAEVDTEKYLKGRGIPGSGGLSVGKIYIRLRVLILQGMRRDILTGARKKVFGSTEADVPIQLVSLVQPAVADKRFEETEELPVEELLPYGTAIIATKGKLRGVHGKVIGPHDATNKKFKRKNDDRTVEIEFSIPPPEPPFGYAIAANIKDDYFSAKDVCKSLQLSTSLLGQIVGSVFVEGMKADLGLNLKRNGQYYCPGYVRRQENNEDENEASSVWTLGDAVQIIASVDKKGEEESVKDAVSWEYSMRAIALLAEYKNTYPLLFEKLKELGYGSKYNAEMLFGPNGKATAEEIHKWIEGQPFSKVPRAPFSTNSMSKDAIKAVERAADVRTTTLKSSEYTPVVMKNVPVDELYWPDNFSSYDAPLTYNCDPKFKNALIKPKLGDRVVNLNSQGVPFGLKGTVVTIHENTGYVEVLFDEEFTGGKSLSGSCSAFRGRLVPWTGLLYCPSAGDQIEGISEVRNKKEKVKQTEKEKKKELSEKQKMLLAKIKTVPMDAAESEKLQKALEATVVVANDKKDVRNVGGVDSKKTEKMKKALASNELKKALIPGKKELPPTEIANVIQTLKKELNIGELPSDATTAAKGTGDEYELDEKEKKRQDLITALLAKADSEDVEDIGDIPLNLPDNIKSDGSGAAALLAAASLAPAESPEVSSFDPPPTMTKIELPSSFESPPEVVPIQSSTAALSSLKSILGNKAISTPGYPPKPPPTTGGGGSNASSALLKGMLSKKNEKGQETVKEKKEPAAKTAALKGMLGKDKKKEKEQDSKKEKEPVAKTAASEGLLGTDSSKTNAKSVDKEVPIAKTAALKGILGKDKEESKESSNTATATSTSAAMNMKEKLAAAKAAMKQKMVEASTSMKQTEEQKEATGEVKEKAKENKAQKREKEEKVVEEKKKEQENDKKKKNPMLLLKPSGLFKKK